jgi:hypothetical protein
MAKNEIVKLPQPLEDALKKAPTRPSNTTPPEVLSFLTNDEEFGENVGDAQLIAKIVSWIDPTLLDLDLDSPDGYKKPNEEGYSKDKAWKPEYSECYMIFAIRLVYQIMGTMDQETKKLKTLDFYHNNKNIHKLKMKEFLVIGDLKNLSKIERADVFATYYKVDETEAYKNLTVWEKELFAELAYTKADTSVEKN